MVAAHLVDLKSVHMLDIPSHHILFLVTVGVGYLIQELLFEFAFTIGDLRQSTYPNLVKP